MSQSKSSAWQAMKNKIVESIKITPSEVKEYYEKIRKTVSGLRIRTSDRSDHPLSKAEHDIETLDIEELTEYKTQVESGAKKFETLASLYSDDPGSKDKGGMYQINRLEKHGTRSS